MLLITLAFLGTSTFAEEKLETNVKVEPKNYIPRKQTFSDTEKLACGILVLGFILEFISMVLIDEVPFGQIPLGPFNLFGILTVILLVVVAIVAITIVLIIS